MPGHWSQRATDALDGKVPRPRPQHQRKGDVKPKASIVFSTANMDLFADQKFFYELVSRGLRIGGDMIENSK